MQITTYCSTPGAVDGAEADAGPRRARPRCAARRSACAAAGTVVACAAPPGSASPGDSSCIARHLSGCRVAVPNTKGGALAASGPAGRFAIACRCRTV